MNTKEKIILFTPYYKAQTSERQKELDECLEKNLACKEIAQIFLLIDDGYAPSIENDKINIINVSNRPTYQNWIDFTKNIEFPFFSVLANSDIYFDSSIEYIRKILQQESTFLSLSRYDRKNHSIVPHSTPHYSQDTWAFHSSNNVPDNLYKALNIPLGVPRCDNKVAYLFVIQGWQLFNPMEEIQSVHLHETQQRQYNKKTDQTVLGGVAYVYPSNKLDKPSYVDIDIWAKNCHAIKNIRLNASLDTWLKSSSKKELSSGSRFGSNSFLDTPFTKQITKQGFSLANIDILNEFREKGENIYQHNQRFYLYRLKDKILYLDFLKHKNAFVGMILDEYKISLTTVPRTILACWIPPIVDISPILIKNKPVSVNDFNFWQYPAMTEKQAYQNHLEIKLEKNIDEKNKTIHTYLPLPWATYIDKKTFPSKVRDLLRSHLMGLKTLANQNGYKLAVHTVCQHIYWQKLLELFQTLNITDLHISHYEKYIDLESKTFKGNLHSWPLIAVNVEVPERSIGLTIGKPLNERKYLASFIGAHMEHYRSDVRLKLLETAQQDGGNDILVEVTNEWHFNKVVYKEQVANKVLTNSEKEKFESRTQYYNEVLSDSVFSLCPEGAGPNTLRVWESLAVGAIPVIISDNWELPKIELDGKQLDSFVIKVNYSEIPFIFEKLRNIDSSRIEEMANNCISIYENIKGKLCF